MQRLNDVVRCRAGRLCREIAHKYLKNRFIDISEVTARDVLAEDPRILADVQESLRKILHCFHADYDPSPLIDFVAQRVSLPLSAQLMLSEAVGREYSRRFEPDARRSQIEIGASRFQVSVDKWLQCVSEAGVGPRSAACWRDVIEAARSLKHLLEQPELAIRWIP